MTRVPTRRFRLWIHKGRYRYFTDQTRRDLAAVRLANDLGRAVYTDRYVGEDPYDLALCHGWAADAHVAPWHGPEDYRTVTYEIKNRYEDGDMIVTRIRDVRIPAPPPESDTAAYDAWLYQHVHDFTGTGRCDGDAYYDVTVTACSDPTLVGRSFQFGY